MYKYTSIPLVSLYLSLSFSPLSLVHLLLLPFQEMHPPKISVALIATLLHSCLSSAQSSSSSTGNATVITSETYFYGQSPPVYPSPNGTGAGDWKAAYAKAQAFVSQLTLSEKVCKLKQAVKTRVGLDTIQWVSGGLVRSTLC
jgi:hypothetical protein